MRLCVVVLAGLLGTSGSVAALLSARAQQVSGADADAAEEQPAPHRMLGWARSPVLQDAAGPLGLTFTASDRALSQDDVQKIAEAWLVWHGNHSWRVIDLASDADHVTFCVATQANVVVASFTMDRHTGALARTG